MRGGLEAFDKMMRTMRLSTGRAMDMTVEETLMAVTCQVMDVCRHVAGFLAVVIVVRLKLLLLGIKLIINIMACECKILV